MKLTETSNFELLQAWSTGGDRDAVGELVRRHIGFVQNVARRYAGVDAHLADDITQAVFILLLRKAGRIRSDAALTSWLYTSTRYAAANACKMLRRQRLRDLERARAAATAVEPQGERAVEQSELERLLHQAMDQLPQKERVCILMSYMQEKTHEQVAAAMGVSPDAVRKRIYRGVERMRAFVTKRGAVVPAAAVAAALAIKSSPVSAAVVESTANVAVLAQGSGALTAASLIAKGANQMFFATKLKAVAAAVAAVFLLGIGTGAITLLAQAATPASGSAPKVAPPLPPAPATPASNVRVEIVGISNMAGDDWHGIDGKAVDRPNMPIGKVQLIPPPTHQAMVRIDKPADADVQISVTNAGGVGTVSSGKDNLITFNLKPGAVAADMAMTAAEGAWKEFLRLQVNSDGITTMGLDSAGFICYPPIAQGDKTIVYVAVSKLQQEPTTGVTDQWKLICIDKMGVAHQGVLRGDGGTGGIDARQYRFDMPMDQMDTFSLQTRPYRLLMTYKGIPLETGGAPAVVETPQAPVP